VARRGGASASGGASEEGREEGMGMEKGRKKGCEDARTLGDDGRALMEGHWTIEGQKGGHWMIEGQKGGHWTIEKDRREDIG